MPHSEREEANLVIAQEAYETLVVRLDPSGVERFCATDYIQHSSVAADGLDGVRAFFEQTRADYPDSQVSIKRVFVDGDYVIFHAHVVPNPGDPGLAVVDIFRMKDGRLAEHWDVIQPVPTDLLNSNGMF